MRSIGWILAVGLSACASVNKPEGFASAQAKVSCQGLKKCNLAFFLEEYRDMPDCIDEQTDDNDDLFRDLEDAECEYDADEAKACLEATQEYARTCEDPEDVAEDCAEVWECPDSVGQPGGGGGSGDDGGDVSLGPACTELAACCASLPAEIAGSCEAAVADADETSCESALALAAGFC